MNNEVFLETIENARQIRKGSDEDDKFSSELEEADEGDDDVDEELDFWRNSFKGSKGRRRPERWAPLGAANDECSSTCSIADEDEDNE